MCIRDSRHSGLRVVMLTGDNQITAETVSRAVGGLDDIRADLKPEDKARIVGELKASGHRVAMAGDGINDAPALAAADVGLAMGTGTDVAIESAGMTLTRGDLSAIVRARKLAHATMRNIRQNLFFSLCSTASACRSRRACCTRLQASCSPRCWLAQRWRCRLSPSC